MLITLQIIGGHAKPRMCMNPNFTAETKNMFLSQL